MKIPDDIEPSVLAIIYSLSNLDNALLRFYRGEAIRRHEWLAPPVDWALENGLLYMRRSRPAGRPLLVHDRELFFATQRGFRALNASRILWCFHERWTQTSPIALGIRAAQLGSQRSPPLLAEREWFFGYDYSTCLREWGTAIHF